MKSMVPFYLIATALVIGGGILSYRQTAATVPLDVKSQEHATLPPRPATEATSTAPPQPFKGEGPWVLAALPHCLEQTQRYDGPKAFVQARLPKDAERLPAGSVFKAADCTLTEDRGTLLVTRGHDRFKLTSDVAVYRSSEGLITFRDRGQLAELRMYRMLR